MSIDEHVIFYNNGSNTIRPKIEHLLADYFRLKEWPETRTCKAMDKNGSNKNHRQHVIYCPFYDALFSDMSVTGVLEFGIGSQNQTMPYNMAGQSCSVGGSIRGWAELFPQARIFGADLDKSVLFNENRIQSYYVHALEPDTITEMWKNLHNDFPNTQINIIVDDAYHAANGNLNLLNGSINHLAENGWYSIEDINRQQKDHVDPIKNWLKDHPYDAVFLDIPNDTNGTNNCLVIIHKTNR